MTAPFLIELIIADFAGKMQPKQLQPVPDGFAKAFSLKQRYETYDPYFAKSGIRFHTLEGPDQSIEV